MRCRAFLAGFASNQSSCTLLFSAAHRVYPTATYEQVSIAVLDGGWNDGWRIETFDPLTGDTDEVIRIFDSVSSTMNISGSGITYTAAGNVTAGECFELNIVSIAAVRYIEVIARGFAAVTSEACP